MRSLSASDYLMLLEYGSGLHAIDRALLVLRYALPDLDNEAIVRLPLGERDRRLLQLHRDNFGDRLDAYADCPVCRERLEFSLSCAVLLAQEQSVTAAVKSVEVDGAHFELRCPDSADAAAIAAAVSVQAGVDVMLTRCVRSAGGFNELTPARRAVVAAELAALDPLAEILLDLSCVACGHDWTMVFDIGHFLWLEIRSRARRLLQEVDALARSYRWSEAEILGLSDARRALYLEMALS